MNTESDRFWKKMASKLRRAQGFHSPTSDEAQKEINDAPEAPLTEAEMASLVDALTSGRAEERTASLDLNWVSHADTCEMDEEVAVLNRRRGETDRETEDLLKLIREQALGDSACDDGEEST